MFIFVGLVLYFAADGCMFSVDRLQALTQPYDPLDGTDSSIINGFAVADLTRGFFQTIESIRAVWLNLSPPQIAHLCQVHLPDVVSFPIF